MDAIKTYLDNVFAAFPQTERVRALKAEMLAGMEERYHALKAEGKSEHEAVGSVIANFGSIGEIAAELGLEQTRQNQAEPAGIFVPREEADAYLAQSKKSSVWIGIGVWIILAGVSALVFLLGLTGSIVGLFVLFSAIAAAVTIFIIHALKLENYKRYEKTTIRLDAQTRTELEQQSAAFMPRFAIHISAGVTVILLAVGVLIALYTFAAVPDSNLLPPALLVITVGLAVFLFITAGMPKGAYDILLGKGDYAHKEASSKAERLIGTIASVYWPAVTAIYLLWSFLKNGWEVSWVIWPVAGVLFGAIAGGINTWHGAKEK